MTEEKKGRRRCPGREFDLVPEINFGGESRFIGRRIQRGIFMKLREYKIVRNILHRDQRWATFGSRVVFSRR